MSNNFFVNHPILGSVFDFNRNGDMNLGEAGAMAAFGALYATESLNAAEEAERELNQPYGKSNKKKQRKESLDDIWFDDWEEKLDKIDLYDHDEVFQAIINDDFDELGTEQLVDYALDKGVRFNADETEEIMEHISDEDLIQRLQWTLEGYL